MLLESTSAGKGEKRMRLKGKKRSVSPFPLNSKKGKGGKPLFRICKGEAGTRRKGKDKIYFARFSCIKEKKKERRKNTQLSYLCWDQKGKKRNRNSLSHLSNR